MRVTNAARKDMFEMDPADLVVVTEAGSPISAELERLAIDEPTVKQYMEIGVILPIVVRKNGKTLDGKDIVEVADGKRRTFHLREANRRLVKLGREPKAIPFVVAQGSDADFAGIAIAANTGRKEDSPLAIARKAKFLRDAGWDDEKIATYCTCTVQAVRQNIKLLDLDQGVIDAVDTGAVTGHAALALVDVPKAEQPTVLQTAIASTGTDGNGKKKKPTARDVNNAKGKSNAPGKKLQNELLERLTDAEEWVSKDTKGHVDDAESALIKGARMALQYVLSGVEKRDLFSILRDVEKDMAEEMKKAQDA